MYIIDTHAVNFNGGGRFRSLTSEFIANSYQQLALSPQQLAVSSYPNPFFISHQPSAISCQPFSDSQILRFKKISYPLLIISNFSFSTLIRTAKKMILYHRDFSFKNFSCGINSVNNNSLTIQNFLL